MKDFWLNAGITFFACCLVFVISNELYGTVVPIENNCEVGGDGTPPSPCECTKDENGNVRDNASNGSIIVFHDSIKAEERLRIALPATLKYFSENI